MAELATSLNDRRVTAESANAHWAAAGLLYDPCGAEGQCDLPGNEHRWRYLVDTRESAIGAVPLANESPAVDPVGKLPGARVRRTATEQAVGGGRETARENCCRARTVQ